MSQDVIFQHVQKKIIYPGRGNISEFRDSARATFHFCTKRLDDDPESPGETIDDSRKLNRPMELLIGKQFKMPIWEKCLKSMKTGEVAQFTIDKCLLDCYPLVSQSYRQFAGVGKPRPKHCCGMAGGKYSTGHEDLDKLMDNPVSLCFTMELVKVEEPGEYEKDHWAMNADEKLSAVPVLKEEGNKFYSEKNFEKAAEKYAAALGHLEQLLLREKPGDEDWLVLDKMKIPLLLNYAQCKLIEKKYYDVITHTTEVLQKDPDNVKALFRRGKAHVGAWNPEDAEADFTKVMDLDPSLRLAVLKELKSLEEEIQRKKDEDKAKLQKMFS